MTAIELPQVDLIIPFHRNDAFLFEALESARLSVGVALRIILINDTGTKIDRDSFSLASEDQFLDSEGTGYVNALKIGVSNSSAEFVAFLDSDDLMSQDRLILQINRLRQDNVDFVSCELIKFRSRRNFPRQGKILGEMPVARDRRLLLLLGSHGADSTLLAKGDSLRTTWKTHALFDSSVADFGWLLQALQQGFKIGHEPEAQYYYRSHPHQLSRNSQLIGAWKAIWPCWELFRKNQLTYLKGFNSVILTENAALALVFPSALVNLDESEIRQLKKALNNLLIDLKLSKESDLRYWRKTLWRRFIIAGKIHAADKFVFVPGLILDWTLTLLSGLKLRNNKRV